MPRDEGCAGDWAQWQGSGHLSPALSGTLVQATHAQGWARSSCHKQSHCHVTDVLRCGSRGNWGVQVLVLLQVQPHLDAGCLALGGAQGHPRGPAFASGLCARPTPLRLPPGSPLLLKCLPEYRCQEAPSVPSSGTSTHPHRRLLGSG